MEAFSELGSSGPFGDIPCNFWHIGLSFREMSSSFALILQCQSPGIAEKLIGVYAALLTERTFPFRFQIHVNPSSDEVRNIAVAQKCLFFLEVESEHDAVTIANIEAIDQQYRRTGHQLVLLAQPTSNYLDLAIRYQVGNILFVDSIVGSTVGALTRRLLGPDFFGFAPFFPHSWKMEQQVLLQGTVNRSGLMEHYFQNSLPGLSEPFRIHFLGQLNELVTNALAYGVLGVTAEQRDANQFQIPTTISIPPGRDVKISVVLDDEKYGISVLDPGGSLTLLRVLQKLRRHTTLPGRVSPMGIEDLTGRGLFILSRQTRMVLNVLRGKQTEVIILGYFDKERNRYKSLIINEKSP